MPVTFYALTPAQLDAYENASAGGADPQDVLEDAGDAAAESYDFLDWESFGLSYLLGEDDPNVRFETVFGPKDQPSSVNVVLPAARAKDVAASLAGISLETLRGRWDPVEMARLGVDPENAWSEPDALDTLLNAFESLLAKPHVSTIIIGARNEEQLRDNLAATDLVLDAAEIAELDRVSALPSEYPAWAIERLNSLGRAPKGAR